MLNPDAIEEARVGEKEVVGLALGEKLIWVNATDIIEDFTEGSRFNIGSTGDFEFIQEDNVLERIGGVGQAGVRDMSIDIQRSDNPIITARVRGLPTHSTTTLVGPGFYTGGTNTAGYQALLDTRSGGRISMRKNHAHPPMQLSNTIPGGLPNEVWFWVELEWKDEAPELIGRVFADDNGEPGELLQTQAVSDGQYDSGYPGVGAYSHSQIDVVKLRYGN